MKRILLTVADRFFLLRPLVLVPAVTFFLLGHYDAREGVEQGQGPFVIAAVFYAMLMGSVYVVNQISDIETDRANDKLFLLPKGIVKRREAVTASIVLAVHAVVGALVIGGRLPLYFILSLVLGLLYSVPPIALKRRFPFDLVANAIGYGILAYSAGWVVVKGQGAQPDVWRAMPYALCVGAVFVLTALADKEGDAKSGFRSAGVVLTLRGGTLLALCLVALALPVALVVENRIAAAGSLLALPFFAFASLRVDPRSVRVAYRCSSAVFVLLVGVLHPLFLVVVLALLGLSRVYYSRRFALDYPSVTGR
ncbi:MAG: UbiA family prenyltransferase [Candidatus Eiseniibacteriota bacterium]|nr:MAG: UbiA family prenyltransferase [Candidatus Eisenbacteria bacterium]